MIIALSRRVFLKHSAVLLLEYKLQDYFLIGVTREADYQDFLRAFAV